MKLWGKQMIRVVVIPDLIYFFIPIFSMLMKLNCVTII